LRNPDALLLDESTAGLDADTRDEVIRNIMTLYSDKIVVFATHDRDLVSRVDEVILLPEKTGSENAQDEAKDPTFTQ
jgi:ABC-type transport system involved in cytochrome bd biosynthesis fused ATPase/permease subunit